MEGKKEAPQSHTKNRPFVFCTVLKDVVCHILSSRVESSEQVKFDSDGLSAMVDNSENAQICSEEDMIPDKIHPTIYKGVATISGKDLFPKGVGTVMWS